MSFIFSPSARFRTARERAGLSVAETATRANISESSVWDLETYDDELTSVYSPLELKHFATIVGVRPSELVGTAERGDPMSSAELASAIRERCRERGITVAEFSEAAGWDVTAAVDTPQMFLTDVSIDGVRDICREAGIEWERFISGL
jgi:transcriptional regulator with XRE-family HTH domain